jgi:hypothetical protein
MLNDSLLPSETLSYLKIPYDLYCPCVQSVLSERMCKSCEQYFASKVMLQQHVSQHKRPPLVPATRARPQRIAARRQRELMVVIAEQENAQSIDWLDESEVVFQGPYHQRMRKVLRSYRRSLFLSYLIHQIGSNSQHFFNVSNCYNSCQIKPNVIKRRNTKKGI